MIIIRVFDLFLLFIHIHTQNLDTIKVLFTN